MTILSKRPSLLHKPLALFVLVFSLAFLATEAVADCSDSKIKRLSRQGKTVATIARSCGMDVEDVRDILDDQDDPQPDDPEPSGGLARGSPLAPCGCWGPVAPGHRQPNEACRSGYAVPRICPQMCPAGGYAWQGVCG